MRISVVIMAGGVGARFWPESRERRPKQLLDVITPGTSLVQSTLQRTLEFASIDDTIVVTNDVQIDVLREQLPQLPRENAISEPFGKNTATCIALGARLLEERAGSDTIMVVLPADHVIRNDH